MSLDELIAAERGAPPTPSATQAKAGWTQLKANAGAAVPAAFDVSPALAKVTLKTKLAAALATTTGKVVMGIGVMGAVATGVAAGRAEAPEPTPTTAVATPPAPKTSTPDAVPVAEVAAPISDAPAAVTPAPEPEPEPETATETATDDAPVAPPVEPAPAEPAPPKKPASSKRATPSKAPAPAAKPDSTFHDELALIRKAQSALAAGRHDDALAALGDHARRFTRGTMKEDRLALRALVLCAAGRDEAGAAAAETFRESYARSLYSKRVDEACP